MPNVPWDSRWREIPYFPNYYINQYGQVFNLKRLALISPYTNQRGVKAVRMYSSHLSKTARGYSRSVNKLREENFPNGV